MMRRLNRERASSSVDFSAKGDGDTTTASVTLVERRESQRWPNAAPPSAHTNLLGEKLPHHHIAERRLKA